MTAACCWRRELDVDVDKERQEGQRRALSPHARDNTGELQQMVALGSLFVSVEAHSNRGIEMRSTAREPRERAISVTMLAFSRPPTHPHSYGGSHLGKRDTLRKRRAVMRQITFDQHRSRRPVMRGCGLCSQPMQRPKSTLRRKTHTCSPGRCGR